MKLPDLETFAFLSGLKPALRLKRSAEAIDAIAADAGARGLFTERAHRSIAIGGRPPEAVLYLARSREAARELAQLEAPILPGGADAPLTRQRRDAHARLGERLGYPPCCVGAFLARLDRDVRRRANGELAHEDFVAAEDALVRSTARLGRLNTLLPERSLRLIAHYPCRFDCAASAEQAGRLHEALRAGAAAEADWLRQKLVARVEVLPSGERLCPPERGGGLVVDYDRF